MKRVVLALSMLLITSFVFLGARKGAAKSGTIKDHLFSDTTYKYRLQLNDEWKTTLFDDDSPRRLLLVHKTLMAGTSASGLSVGGSETPAKVEFWVVADSTLAGGIVDSLVSPTYNSPLKSKILASPEGFWQISGFEKTDRGTRRLSKYGGKEAVSWKGLFIYKSTTVAHVALGIGLQGIDCGSYGILSLVYAEPKIIDSAFAATSKILETLKVE